MKLLGILIFLFSIQLVNAQKPPSAEELWATWENDTVPPVKRVRALSNFIWNNILFRNPDSAYVLAEIEYQYAVENNLNEFRANALNMKAMTKQLQFKFEESLSLLEESYKIYEKEGLSKQALLVKANTAHQFSMTNDYPKALELFNEVFDSARITKDARALKSVFTGITNIHQSRGNYAEAALFLEKQLAEYSDYMDASQNLTLISTLSENYSLRGNYRKSI
ncbi:MAG: tetratricopeptide repeat protein, partial [Crocinitomicaceae bacterium]|nr:tetratricopeptide repeat protein [Crocinitomicaceae bacterium]